MGAAESSFPTPALDISHACVHKHQEEMRPHRPRISSDITMNVLALPTAHPHSSQLRPCVGYVPPPPYLQGIADVLSLWVLGEMRLGAALMHSQELGHNSPYLQSLPKVA